MSPSQILIILWRRKWVIALAFCATMTGALAVLYLVPKRYEASTTATIDATQPDPVTGQAAAVSGNRLLQGNLLALIKSQRVAQEVVKRIGLANSPQSISDYRTSGSVGAVTLTEWLADNLVRNIDARFADGTNVLTISYKTTVPGLAASVANAFMGAFVDAAVEVKVAGAQQTAQWVEPQTEKLRQEVEVARDKASKFQIKENLSPTNSGDSDFNILQSVTNDLQQARADLLSLNTTARIFASDNPDVSAVEAQAPESVLYNSLRGQLSSVNNDISRLQPEIGAKNPKITVLIAQRRALEAQIKTERETRIATIKAREKALAEKIASLETARIKQVRALADLQYKRDQLSALQQEVELRQSQLTAVVRAGVSARMQTQLSFTNIAVLDKAVPPTSPSFPKKLLVIPAGIGAGLALGLVLALLVEALDRRVRSLSDLRYASSSLVLGQLHRTPNYGARRLAVAGTKPARLALHRA
ncbi:hypothetical protein ES708_03226 [subsurface metagenome]